MKTVTEINQEYITLLENDRKSHAISAQDQLRYINNSTAKYHGRCVRSLYVPKLFTEKEKQLFDRLITDLYGIFYKVIKEYFENEDYRKLFGFSKELEALILREPLYDSMIPISRIDIFLNEENGDFKFCEFNTDGSSAMNEDRELNEAVKFSKAYKEFSQKYNMSTFELFDSWVTEVKKIYATYKKKVEHPTVAIVDFMESATSNEFSIFKDAFEKQGFRTEICEIRDLKYTDGNLYSEGGMKIDIIYRRAVTSDIYKNIKDVPDFIQAVKDDNVCLLGEFRTQIVHNKILYKILHQESTLNLLNDYEKEYVKRHVPFTVSLDKGSFDYEEVIADKDKWIIKPEDSYGSKGVHAGVECDDAQWKEFVDESMGSGYLLQEFCIPFRTYNIDLLADGEAELKKYSNLTGLFVYNGRFSGVYSRISSVEMISTQYSEMALPTIIASEK